MLYCFLFCCNNPRVQKYTVTDYLKGKSKPCGTDIYYSTYNHITFQCSSKVGSFITNSLDVCLTFSCLCISFPCYFYVIFVVLAFVNKLQVSFMFVAYIWKLILKNWMYLMIYLKKMVYDICKYMHFMIYLSLCI